MKRILFILPVFFAFTVNAQPGDVPVNVGNKFGNYKWLENDTKTKPVNGETTIRGVVIALGTLSCQLNKCSVNLLNVKTEDGSVLVIETMNHGYMVPRNILGKNLSIEGINLSGPDPERRNPRYIYLDDTRFAASGILVIK